MPVYRLTITKELQSGNDAKKRWSNVYHLNDASMAEAVLHAPVVVDYEKTIYPDNVAIVRWALSDPAAPNTGQSTVVFVEGTAGAATPDTQLPLFNAVLFKFNTATGRPSLKYLRLPLDESQVTGGQVNQAVLDTITTNWAIPVQQDTNVCDESGNAFTSYGFSHSVISRQVGWHRRTRPGQKRGWVPA